MVILLNYKIPITKSIEYDCSRHINVLLAGSRGMGKSWFGMYLILKLAQLKSSTQIYAIDYKQSDISRLKEILPEDRVAISKEEIFSVLENFVTLMKARAEYVNKNTEFGSTANDLGMPLFYLIYDEFGAFTQTLSTKEKKYHDDLISQIVLLGRQYNFGLLAIMQQASVGNSGLNSSIKEQFGLIAHMGSASSAAYRQTFGESIEVPDIKLERGHGFIWMQELTTNGNVYPFSAPDLSGINLWDIFQKSFSDQKTDDYLTMIEVKQ